MQLLAASTDATRAADMSGRIRGGKVTYEKLPSFDLNGLSKSTSEQSSGAKTTAGGTPGPFDSIPVS